MPGVRLVALNAVLLAMVFAAILGSQLLDRSEAAVEASVRRYADAVSSNNREAALDEIAPEARARWGEFVAEQVGNVYEVRGIAVRSPSVLDRLLRRAPLRSSPVEVTVVLDVDRTEPEAFFRSTTRVPVEEHNGRWYLSEPLLAET